jgi:hypothetical protein
MEDQGLLTKCNLCDSTDGTHKPTCPSLSRNESCNLCHEPAGTHKATCPNLIRVDWNSSGSVWEQLCRELFDMYVSAQSTAILDRGSAKDERDLDTFERYCRQSLEDGDPYTVLEFLRLREA